MNDVHKMTRREAANFARIEPVKLVEPKLPRPKGSREREARKTEDGPTTYEPISDYDLGLED